MSRFVVTKTPIESLLVVERRPIGDERGSLTRVFCSADLSEAGWVKPVAQINQTITQLRGTVRGLHYQLPPYAEMKLVSCVRGEVWDVAVDLRRGSTTFLHWYAEYLSAENRKALLIPEGFAHGFQSVTDGAELLYLHSAYYQSAAEAGVNFQDPRLGITWPLPVVATSGRDRAFPLLDRDFSGLEL